MNVLKTLWILSLILASTLIWQVNADPEPKPEPAKAHRSAYYNEPANPRFRSVPLAVKIDDDDDDEAVAELRQAVEVNDNANNEDSITPNVSPKGEGSSGRLFIKKLFFKNFFGANNQQPVIPIIITGAGNTAPTTPTQTITTTGTVPTATGTITTQPTNRQRSDSEEELNNESEEPQAVNVQALQAALAANAHEYVVTDQEIKGTSDSKSSKQPQSVNLRPQGGNGQYIRVRIPPKYHRYFKKGQKVMLNTSNRVGNRRVIRKRKNKNRRRVNRNNRNN